MMEIRIIIVEDDPEIRDWISGVISSAENLTLSGAFPDAESCIESYPGLNPDIVIMDIHLPGMNGIECVSRLKPAKPSVQFMMFTVFEEDNKVFDSLRAGASGYILKNYPADRMIEAIHELYNGGSPMSSVIARKVINSFSPDKEKQSELEKLSKREKEILNLLAKGYRYKEIADQMNISTETVRTHIRNIYEKLQVQSRTEALNKVF